MLGRPLMIEPVFMNACAVSWLICSVCIERITQRSSAIPAMCGKSSLTSRPDRPCLLKVVKAPRALSTAF